MSGPAYIAARSALWILLGGWIGAQLLFATTVAPTAFQVLPSTELAGRLVSPVLAVLHLSGAAAGVALALLAALLRRGATLTGLPLGMAAVCLFSHFGVTAELAEIRDPAFGPAPSAATAARLAHLHRLSVALFAAVAMGILCSSRSPRGARERRVRLSLQGRDSAQIAHRPEPIRDAGVDAHPLLHDAVALLREVGFEQRPQTLRLGGLPRHQVHVLSRPLNL